MYGTYTGFDNFYNFRYKNVMEEGNIEKLTGSGRTEESKPIDVVVEEVFEKYPKSCLPRDKKPLSRWEEVIKNVGRSDTTTIYEELLVALLLALAEDFPDLISFKNRLEGLDPARIVRLYIVVSTFPKGQEVGSDRLVFTLDGEEFERLKGIIKKIPKYQKLDDNKLGEILKGLGFKENPNLKRDGQQGYSLTLSKKSESDRAPICELFEKIVHTHSA